MDKLVATALALMMVAILLSEGCSGAEGKLATQADTATSVAGTPAVSSSATPTRGERSTATPSIPAIPTTEPHLTPPANASDLQLALVDSDGDISLIAHDGSNKKKLLDSEQCAKPVQLLWSPAGNRLACLSEDFVEIDTGSRARTLARYNIAVVDIEGRVLTRIEAAGSLVWSPDARHMAFSVFASVTPTVAYIYHVADADGNVSSELPGTEGNLIWSPDGSSIAYNDDSHNVAIYDISAKEIRRLGSGINRALAWALGGKALLVVSNLVEEGIGARYDSHLLDLTSGQLRRAPPLYSPSGKLWTSADGEKAVVLVFRELERVTQLGILDVATLTTTPIQGSTIRFPSEIIPHNHVIFSPDVSLVYWIDVEDGLSIYKARTDGTGMIKIASLPGIISIRLSPDLTKMAYRVPGNPPTLRISNLDGSGVVELGPILGPFAWRP